MIRAAPSSTADSQADVGRNRKSKMKLRVPNNESKSKISELEQKFKKLLKNSSKPQWRTFLDTQTIKTKTITKLSYERAFLIHRIYLNSQTTVYFCPKIKLLPTNLPFQIFHDNNYNAQNPFPFH